MKNLNHLGFYISDHPLNNYKNIFSQLNIKPYKDFIIERKKDSLIAGTLMSIQEKKVQKEHRSQLQNLVIILVNMNFLYFLNYLIKNREILKEGESFVITLFKDKIMIKKE